MEQYGIANVWQQGDFVTRFIFVFLIGMSVVSWFVILTKGFSNRRLESLGKRAQTGFWSSASDQRRHRGAGRARRQSLSCAGACRARSE